ncbi:PREDICTED: ceramide kinase-like, partial [Apaloderma vittatum]|uniref:ceramide kinase-like n=1 Tax=Apaloderma vittatum TaxID=57397 RepID=UPI00052190B7
GTFLREEFGLPDAELAVVNEQTLTGVLSEFAHELRKCSVGVADGDENCFVPTSEIIAVEETECNKKQRNIGKWQKMAKPHAFTVYYVKKSRNHRWRCSDVTFWCVDEHLCNQWIQALKESLEMQKSRPKNLLVYINPYGGKRQGKRIYEQKVAPLFSLASISTDVVITEHANHAKDNLFEVNINKYDGVVCVGGDGTFSEVMHGLIGRMQKDSGIDQNNPKAPLVQCNIKSIRPLQPRNGPHVPDQVAVSAPFFEVLYPPSSQCQLLIQAILATVIERHLKELIPGIQVFGDKLTAKAGSPKVGHTGTCLGEF